MAVVIGKMTTGAVINTDTPAYQVDEATAGTTYIRYEDTTDTQYIKRIVEASSVTTMTYTYDTWANRASATYSPINQ